MAGAVVAGACVAVGAAVVGEAVVGAVVGAAAGCSVGLAVPVVGVTAVLRSAIVNCCVSVPEFELTAHVPPISTLPDPAAGALEPTRRGPPRNRN